MRNRHDAIIVLDAMDDPAAPYRLVTGRLELRCYEVSDAPLLKEAVDSSLDHLREFMDWAWDAPEPLDAYAARIDGFRSRFEAGEDFVYALFAPGGVELVGGAGLHPRVGPGGLEIGYWVRASRVREGLATAAAAALTRVGFEHCGVERVEIRIDPANTASLGVPPKLGYTYDATLRKRLPPKPPTMEWRDVAIFSLLADEYPESPAAQVAVEAFNHQGRPA